MLIDLTDIFVQALERAFTWRAEEVSAKLEQLLLREGGRFEWSRVSGEEWMALEGMEPQQYALAWTHAPPAILQPSVSQTLRNFLARHNALLIEAADWHAVAYCLHPAVICAHGLSDFRPLGPNDPTEKAMSLLDLYTVTNDRANFACMPASTCRQRLLENC